MTSNVSNTLGRVSLERLLSQCKPLHSGGTLTLQQLVPVHQSLLQCSYSAATGTARRNSGEEQIIVETVGGNDQNETSESKLDIAIRQSCQNCQEDQILCRQILFPSSTGETSSSSSSYSDSERLLVIQYLMFPYSNNMVAAMRFVLMPYLLSNSRNMDKNLQGNFGISEDLKIVLLECISTNEISSHQEQQQQLWHEMIESLQAHPDPMSSRLLVRLMLSTSSTAASKVTTNPILIQAFYEKLWQTIQLASSTFNSNDATDKATTTTTTSKDPLMSCLSRDLLPVLTETAATDGDEFINGGDNKNKSTPVMCTDLYRDHTKTLWKRIFSLLRAEEVKKQSHDESSGIPDCTVTTSTPPSLARIYLVLTAVLCPLLPNLLEVELPCAASGENVDSDESFLLSVPTQQAQVWTLIYSCLEQGKSVLTRGDENPMSVSSILRKRALYLLDKLASSPSSSNIDIWKKYVMCVEVLEMESEQHLVEQIWETVTELLDESVRNDHSNSTNTTTAQDQATTEIPPFGVLNLEWMSLLFSRILSSGQLVIRKLGVYRLLKKAESIDDDKSAKSKQQKKQGKKKTRHIDTKSQILKRDKPMVAYMNPEFVFNVFLPSWNSLAKSVGYNMHIENNRKVEREDMVPLFTSFICSYMEQLPEKDAQEFWMRLWDFSLLQHFQTKTTVIIFQALAQKLSSEASNLSIYADNDALESLLNLYQSLFGISSVLISHRKELLLSLAIMLEKCRQPQGSTKKWVPLTILHLLSFFSEDYFPLEDEDWSIEDDQLLGSLKRWISGFEQDATVIGAAVSAAFVSGQLAPSDKPWDMGVGSSDLEYNLSWAISLLCTLAASHNNKTTTGALLWPSINKGLANSAGTILANDRQKARNVARAILLLENGCKLRQLSGLGNGDLVVDKNTQQLMPPPANIEKILSSSIDFILYHIHTLLSMKDDDQNDDSGDGSSSTQASAPAKQTAKAFGRLISQLRTLQRSYPSSDRMSSAVRELLTTSCERLKGDAENDNNRVVLTALIFAAVSSGADPGKKEYIPLCRSLLHTALAGDVKCSKSWEQTLRTVLMYARWGAISYILPLLIKSIENGSSEENTESESFFKELLSATFAAVGATPISALPPLFNCVLEAGKYVALSSPSELSSEKEFAATFSNIINVLLRLMDDTSGSSTKGTMLNEVCKLAFQPKLLAEESDRLRKDEKSPDPIRQAFRQLIKMAGVQRHHISRAVLCRITVGWLGEDHSQTSSLGLNAIPYRDDIVKLLLFKEQKIEDTAVNQSRAEKLPDVTKIPATTNELSVSRAFVLIFLSKLPDAGNGLNDFVLKELIHYIILRLLSEIVPEPTKNYVLIMKGTTDYCKKMRGWQALCCLARFVTADVAEEVCKYVFNAMPDPIHSQIRYFMEVFTIKCGTMHPAVFGPAFIKDIGQNDLSLPHVSSLMIIGGNWIVGRYKIDFFKKPVDPNDDLHLRQVLAAVIPWLSSTQGFSRAIAQLLAYALIPLVTDVSQITEGVLVTDTDWFIRLIYKFLEENREMRRLRNKQSKFFERYNVEETCTVKGILSIPVDEGEEAAPEQLVDVMKVALKHVYDEAHASDVPEWKQVEYMLQNQSPNESQDDNGLSVEEPSVVNFQRKIIPLDALNLAMEDLREKKLRNIAGQRKQQLIVCASLVDKVPNLGGLARTAEIFAADRLVIPDIGVTKMDNFKSISVGAGDWIDIEEVKEMNLLSWLLEHKKKGYFVFGLEQTSSSVSISEMNFPDRPTILLLGKEKEGIPVEFLQAVDQCVEIPQLGIIRSLNVHVSGAIAIWEHTKQRRLPSS